MNEIGANSGYWSAHFLLVNDIDLADLTGTQFNIIGNSGNAFTGVFDGNDNRILNFSYSDPCVPYIGMFGYVDGNVAGIKDVNLVNAIVTGSDYVGALVGRLVKGMVSGCSIDGAIVTGQSYVGGLVGYNDNGRVTGCLVDTGLEAFGSYCGGLVGYNKGLISGCTARSTTYAATGQYCGGLAGSKHFSCRRSCRGK
jgi:hypothetical protein